jgi:hypothetical protein
MMSIPIHCALVFLNGQLPKEVGVSGLNRHMNPMPVVRIAHKRDEENKMVRPFWLIQNWVLNINILYLSHEGLAGGSKVVSRR